MTISKTRQKLARRLRKLRQEYDLTQEEAAEIAGIDPRHWQKFERLTPPKGSKLQSPVLETLEKLAKPFKMTISQLTDFD